MSNAKHTPGPLEMMARTRRGDDRFLAGQLHALGVSDDDAAAALGVTDREALARLLLCRAVAKEGPQRTRDINDLALRHGIDQAALRELLGG